MHRSVFAVALSLAIIPVPSIAQQPELPAEVQEWMTERWQQRFMAMVRLGDSIFSNGSCARCHGDDATGTRRAPDLTDDEWVQSDGSLGGIFETIFWGVRRRDFADPNRRFQMNPAGGMNLEWDEMRAVTAFVWSLRRRPAN